MTVTYSATNLTDLGNALPTLFGFIPRESLIVVTTTGERRRFGFRLRQDLDDLTPANLSTFVDYLVPIIDQQDGDGVYIITVTDDADTAATVTRAIARAITTKTVHGAMRFTNTYRDGGIYTDPRHATSDQHTYPLGVDHTTAVPIAAAIAEGVEILPTREALADTWRPRPTTPPQADGIAHASSAEAETAWLEWDARQAIDRAIEDGHTSVTDRISLTVAASVIGVRDALQGMITRDNAREHLRVWRDIAVNADPSDAANPYALAALAAWLSGNTAIANIATEQARIADPHNSLAELVAMVCRVGLSPTAWNPTHA